MARSARQDACRRAFGRRRLCKDSREPHTAPRGVTDGSRSSVRGTDGPDPVRYRPVDDARRTLSQHHPCHRCRHHRDLAGRAAAGSRVGWQWRDDRRGLRPRFLPIRARRSIRPSGGAADGVLSAPRHGSGPRGWCRCRRRRGASSCRRPQGPQGPRPGPRACGGPQGACACGRPPQVRSRGRRSTAVPGPAGRSPCAPTSAGRSSLGAPAAFAAAAEAAARRHV